ncbi:MAG: KEOPS complex subunit Cgi121, partial [archaeon]|nr:KEOPS complex subunit Cgi121 [archaeon]
LMLSKTIGKHDYSLLKGEISTDSYKETIKKLTLGFGVFTQVIPSKWVAGEDHIWFALEQSLDAFEQKIAFTKKPELEFIVRLLAQKQLSKALEGAEFGKGTEFGKEPLVLVIGSSDKKIVSEIKEKLAFEEKEIKLGLNKSELIKFFGIEEKEIESLADVKNPLEELIVERCAFVSLEK